MDYAPTLYPIWFSRDAFTWIYSEAVLTTAERYQRMLDLMAAGDQSYLILASIAILFTLLWFIVVQRVSDPEKCKLSKKIYFAYYSVSMIAIMVWSAVTL